MFPSDKPKTVRYLKDTSTGNFVRVPDFFEGSSGNRVKSSITIPPSLQTLLINGSSEVGVVFSMYETGVMFPIAEGNGARRNETNVSSVISATVLGHTLNNLKENITYTIQISEVSVAIRSLSLSNRHQ